MLVQVLHRRSYRGVAFLMELKLGDRLLKRLVSPGHAPWVSAISQNLELELVQNSDDRP